ncbi:Mov34/MPN/PAD-1 family protein [Pyxidicoccus parkwayensis]|uniref:Mov34/MPN/PAD-1 family protein n=1 Tax=Pyxidicoccus parkwayensis TaxID=2813578 RepID=A0ABX7NPX3_9BACT|nr:Mov34/MPN/PAD-1 family protein [Pyxidicoccus parkwaysis]QSQ20733.1 Mov34/MPN/PAD-1 family protein [Pyxidicoccus parkwaysis]
MSKAAKAEKTQQPARAFPGGDVAPTPGELRIAVEKQPYAQIIGHAVLEPDVEVCGVLVGRLLEDARGPYLSITAVIRGEAAKQQGAQVTFTHDTWNHIHKEMDAKYPDEQIVGWYHTHGGFGIFLSDMDTFIHRNFFSQPHQVAYVYDPLAGTEGFFHGMSGELKQVQRYWLAGRERKPLGAAVTPASSSEGGGGDLASAVNALTRAAAALQASANKPSKELLPIPMWAVAAAVLLLAGYTYLSGGLSGRGAEGARRSQTMLVLDQDPATGTAVGLEVVQLAPERGDVLRDRNGELYVGVPLRQADGRPASLLNVLQGSSGASAPEATAPKPAPTPPATPPGVHSGAQASMSRVQVLLVAGGTVLALVLSVVGVLFLRRRHAGNARMKVGGAP